MKNLIRLKKKLLNENSTKNLCLCIIILLILNLYFLVHPNNESIEKIVFISNLQTNTISNSITTDTIYNYNHNPFYWLTGNSVHVPSCFSKPLFIDSYIKYEDTIQENVSPIISQVKHEIALAERYSKNYIKELEGIIDILQQEVTIK